MILSRYIFFEFLKKVSTVLFIMVLLYLVIDFFEKIDEFVVQKATMKQLFGYFIYKIPLIITQIMPIAVLIATIFLIGIFAKNNELTAMKACGIPIIKIVSPILATAFILSLVIFILNELVVPRATEKSNYIFQVEIRKWKSTTFFNESNIWIKGQNNFFWNVGYFDKKHNVLNNIRVFKVDEDSRVEYRVDAQKAVWKGGSWELFKGSFWDFRNPLKLHAQKIDREEFKVLKTPPSAFKIVHKPSEELNVYELNEYIKKVESEGYDATRYRVDWHSKFSFPFLSFVMAMLAVPFSIGKARNWGTFIGIGISIIIGFTAWVVMSFGISLGRGGLLPPFFAAWFGNFIFMSIGLYFLLTSKQ